MGYSFLEVPLCLSGVGPVQNDGRYGIYDGDIGHDICRLSQSESPQSTLAQASSKREHLGQESSWQDGSRSGMITCVVRYNYTT